MTSKLRPAMEVFLDTLIAWEDRSDWDYIAKALAAAAVIEADRETVRAEAVREIVAILKGPDRHLFSVHEMAERIETGVWKK